MDPNANLCRQHDLQFTWIPADGYRPRKMNQHDRAELRDLRLALAEWLHKGGCEPDEYDRGVYSLAWKRFESWRKSRYRTRTWYVLYRGYRIEYLPERDRFRVKHPAYELTGPKFYSRAAAEEWIRARVPALC